MEHVLARMISYSVRLDRGDWYSTYNNLKVPFDALTADDERKPRPEKAAIMAKYKANELYAEDVSAKYVVVQATLGFITSISIRKYESCVMNC